MYQMRGKIPFDPHIIIYVCLILSEEIQWTEVQSKEVYYMDTAVKKENIEQELLLQMLDRGIDDIQEGRVYKIDEAFEKASEIRQMRENERNKRS